jgi:cytochrome c5
MSFHRTLVLILLLLPAANAIAAAPGNGDAGRAVYESSCRACHDPANVMVSSPKAGDAAEWAKRLDKGIEKLTDNAANGIGAMPPKGGAAELNRDQIRDAILHMAAPRQ